MKSLILSAQDARELEKLGGLTITKPIKPTPPYIEGARFAEQAPGWIIVGPDARRLGAEDGVADMFAPPVRPGDAVFIREPWYRLRNPQGGESERVILAADSVVGEEQTAYKWASPVSMPEDAARRFARVKSVSPIYAELVAQWAIELETISKDAALAADAGVPFSATDDPEDASTYYTYAGDMTPEDHERMVAAIDADRARLDEVRARRAEIAATDPQKRVLDALDEEDAILDEEEAALVAALEDAGIHTDAQEEAAPSDDTEAQDVGAPSEEDEEIGSFTLGKCRYCGREWGVTLEGAREGGYPTQRTADAAATRLCDCEEAVANREPIVGVAMAVTTGACRYCGQLQEVGPHPSQAAADETATEVCNCPKARNERRVHEQIEDARERVQRLFGDGAASLDFKPIPDEAVGLLERVVELIARGPISSASLNVRGQCKAKFSITSKGKIKVSRSETRSCDLEAGE